jgi:hypothetical protein
VLNEERVTASKAADSAREAHSRLGEAVRQWVAQGVPIPFAVEGERLQQVHIGHSLQSWFRIAEEQVELAIPHVTHALRYSLPPGTHGSTLTLKPLAASPAKGQAAAPAQDRGHEYGTQGEASPQQHQRVRNAAVQQGGRTGAAGRSRNSLRYMLDKLGLDLGKVGEGGRSHQEGPVVQVCSLPFMW